RAAPRTPCPFRLRQSDARCGTCRRLRGPARDVAGWRGPESRARPTVDDPLGKRYVAFVLTRETQRRRVSAFNEQRAVQMVDLMLHDRRAHPAPALVHQGPVRSQRLNPYLARSAHATAQTWHRQTALV